MEMNTFFIYATNASTSQANRKEMTKLAFKKLFGEKHRGKN